MFETETRTESRWLSVVFLQGEDADQVIDAISRRGPAAGIERLRQWDYGDETTDAALVDGYVYDRIPAGSTDRILVQPNSPYALTYSTAHRYVSLLRRYPAVSEPVPVRSARRDLVGVWGSPNPTAKSTARNSVAM